MVEPLQFEWPDGRVDVSAARAGQDPHHLGGQDGAPIGRGTQPRRLDHRGAVDVVVFERHVAGRQPDPDGQHDLPLGGPVHPVDRLLDGDGGGHRIGRSGEDGHDAVAQALDDPAGIPLHRLRQDPVVGAPQLVGGLVSQPAPQLRGTDEVGEEHRGRRPGGHKARSYGPADPCDRGTV